MPKSYEKYIVQDPVSTKQAAPKRSWAKYVVDSQLAQDEIEAQKEDTGKDLALLAAQGASQDWLDEVGGVVKSAIKRTPYEQERDALRQSIQEARDRQGIAGDAAELAGNVGVTMIPGARLGTTAAKELALAAIQGAGAANEMEDIPKQAIASSAISGGTQIVGKGVEKLLFSEPDKILARTMGARNSDFLKARKKVDANGNIIPSDKSPDQVSKFLDNLGFFRQGEVVFDTQKKKFVPNPTKSRLETFFKPKSLDSLHDRAQIAMTAIRGQKEKILKGKTISGADLDNAINAGIADFGKGYDVQKRAEIAQELKQKIMDDLHALGAAKTIGGTPHLGGGRTIVDAMGLDTYKGYLGDEVSKSFEKRLREVGISDEGIMAMRDKIDGVLDKVGGIDYKDLNEISHKLNLAAEDASQKVARESATGVEKPTLTRGSLWDRAVDFVNPAAVGVGRARIGKGVANDNYVLEGVREGFKRTPVELYNNNPSPEEEVQVPYRAPNSVPNIPEQFIRTPLPRTTEGLMKNKSFVLGKVAQMMPDMFEAVKDTYDHEPERIGELAQVIAQKMPHLFERDKYNRFDGRILSEQDKQKAIKDTLLDTRLSSIDQAKIITKLNKEGIYDR